MLGKTVYKKSHSWELGERMQEMGKISQKGKGNHLEAGKGRRQGGYGIIQSRTRKTRLFR